jgi:hypothetical protein
MPPTPKTRTPVFTSHPDVEPPQLCCPRCNHPLVYRETVIGGVRPVERWHRYGCRACGTFVYRERTRTLRPDAA